MDAFGTIIPHSEEFADYEFGDQTAESEELGNSDFDDPVSKSSETHESWEMRPSNNADKDRGTAEPRGSSWIGSAVSGWFADDADKEGKGNKEQENFKSRKLALDLEQLDEEETQPKPVDWAGDGLRDALGLKDKTENSEESPSERVSYLLGNRIKSVLGFGGGGGGEGGGGNEY